MVGGNGIESGNTTHPNTTIRGTESPCPLLPNTTQSLPCLPLTGPEKGSRRGRSLARTEDYGLPTFSPPLGYGVVRSEVEGRRGTEGRGPWSSLYTGSSTSLIFSPESPGNGSTRHSRHGPFHPRTGDPPPGSWPGEGWGRQTVGRVHFPTFRSFCRIGDVTYDGGLFSGH